MDNFITEHVLVKCYNFLARFRETSSFSRQMLTNESNQRAVTPSGQKIMCILWQTIGFAEKCPKAKGFALSQSVKPAQKGSWKTLEEEENILEAIFSPLYSCCWHFFLFLPIQIGLKHCKECFY